VPSFDIVNQKVPDDRMCKLRTVSLASNQWCFGQNGNV